MVLDAMVAVIVELLRWEPSEVESGRYGLGGTIDGRNPAITTWDVQNHVNNGTNYQPQPVTVAGFLNHHQ